MNKAFFIIATTIALVGCGKDHNDVVRIDAAYVPYWNNVQSLATSVGTRLSITDIIIKSSDHDLGSRVLGLCIQPNEDADDDDDAAHPTVLVSTSAWAALNDHDRNALVAHESLHCGQKYKLLHDSTTASNGNPMSIMNPYLPRVFYGSFAQYMTASALGASTAPYIGPADSLYPQ